MQVPMQIVFEGIGHSDAIEARVRDEVDKLEKFYGRITAARIVVGRPQHRHAKGDTYQTRIHLTIPGGGDVVVNVDPSLDHAHEDVYVTIHEAFKAARRQLQDIVRERRPTYKSKAD